MYRRDVADSPDRRYLIVSMTVAGIVVAAVLAVVRGLVPAGALPTASPRTIAAIPHVNAVLSLAAIASIAVGWTAIRRGRVIVHRQAMLLATGLFAAFLTLYLYRLAMLGGPTTFPGPSVAYRFVYLPVLVVHVALAICCIPLLSYVLALGLGLPVSRIPDTVHPSLGRVAAALWMASFALGVLVYVLLYWVW